MTPTRVKLVKPSAQNARERLPFVLLREAVLREWATVFPSANLFLATLLGYVKQYSKRWASGEMMESQLWSKVQQMCICVGHKIQRNWVKTWDRLFLSTRSAGYKL